MSGKSIIQKSANYLRQHTDISMPNTPQGLQNNRVLNPALQGIHQTPALTHHNQNGGNPGERAITLANPCTIPYNNLHSNLGIANKLTVNHPEKTTHPETHELNSQNDTTADRNGNANKTDERVSTHGKEETHSRSSSNSGHEEINYANESTCPIPLIVQPYQHKSTQTDNDPHCTVLSGHSDAPHITSSTQPITTNLPHEDPSQLISKSPSTAH